MVPLSHVFNRNIHTTIVAILVSICMAFSTPFAYAQEATTTTGATSSQAQTQAESSVASTEQSSSAATVIDRGQAADEPSMGETTVSSSQSTASSSDATEALSLSGSSQNSSSETTAASASKNSVATPSSSAAAKEVTVQEEEPEVAPQSSEGDQPEGNHANVVVMVRFSDDAVGDGETGYNAPYAFSNSYTEWQLFQKKFTFDSGYGGEGVSLAEYMDTISNGAYKVASFFPQTLSGYKVDYITLPRTKAGYASESNPEYYLMRDVLSQMNTKYGSQAASWDKDTDGYIDNLDVMIQVSASVSDSDDFTYPHKANYEGGDKVGGLSVGTYNVINTKRLDSICHEYMHSVGLGDLYRVGGNSSDGDPVRGWDLMATDTVYGITGQSKQDIGWTTIPTVSEAGTYTLHKAYTEGERTFFKVASPYSADEYFVFEYKNKPSNNMAVDGHIASSGLIVYRVNTAFGEKSNKYKDDSGNYKDYLYVFRPGETDIHASAGNIQEAMMVAPNWSYSNATVKHSSFGSATMTDGIEAGAITDSLNRNSGITVNVTAQDSTSVTFDLSIPDYADVDLWKQATATDGTGATYAVNGTGTVDVASDESGGAYLLTNNGKLEVRHFTGAQWKSLGNPTTATSLGCAQIECVDGVPYCLVANYPGGSSNSVQLLAYKNGAWSTVGSVSTGASCSNAATLSVSGGDLFVVVDKDNANSKVYKLGSSGLQALGAELDSSFLLAPVVFVVDGTTYVAYGDFPLGFGSTASGLHVDKLVGNTWQEVYQGGSTNARGKAVAVYHDNALPGSGCNAALILSTSDVDVAPTLYKVTASGVSLVTAFPEYASSNNGLGLCIKGDNAYLLFAQGAETPAAEMLTASLDDLTAWAKLGETVASPSDSAAMAISGNSVFVASQNRATEKATLYSHAVMESEPPAPQPVDIAGATIASIPDQTVTGSEIKPALTVTIDGSTLNEGTDYTVVYTGNIAVGTATATITGINDYTGTKSATFKIVAATPPITKIDKPIAKTGLVYNGSAQTAVDAATAYTVTNGVATNAGTYTATAKLKDKTTTAWSDGTTDDVSISYTIAKKSITKPTAKTGLVYNGSNQVGVAAATGYTVTNGAATNAGNYTATATLADKANTQWAGTTSSADLSMKYTIAKANISKAFVSAPACTYRGSALKPDPTVTLNKKLLPKSAYTVSYSNNRNVGTAKITITGTGNYTGTATGTFAITYTGPYVKKTLATGAYTINTKLGATRLVDISGRSVSNGANAQMYQGNETPAQRFYVEWHVAEGQTDLGYYTLKNVYSGKHLDAAGGKANQGTNVQQYQGNGTLAQRWILTKDNGYYQLRNAAGNKVLDISGNNPYNGANLQLWTPNGTSAQRFAFVSCEQLDIKTGESNRYYIRNVANGSRVVDVAGASTANSANIQLYNGNRTAAQQFYFTYDKKTGYYIIRNAKSKKAIDVAGAGQDNGNNIQQYQSNGTYAQKWSLKKSGNSYVMYCACNGRCFDLAGGSTANGNNIWCWDANGTKAQKWNLQRL